MTQQIVRVDGIKWWVTKDTSNNRLVVALCPDHDLRMTTHPEGQVRNSYNTGWRKRTLTEALKLECAEGPHLFDIPREYEKEQKYVYDRIDAQIFKGMQIVDLDGELTPIAKEKLKSEDGKYFVTSQLMQSKRGLQLVVYAGKKGSTKKTQIFIEPEIKRLAFDQKDLNPTEVFVEMKAIFFDGTSHEVKGKNND